MLHFHWKLAKPDPNPNVFSKYLLETGLTCWMLSGMVQESRLCSRLGQRTQALQNELYGLLWTEVTRCISIQVLMLIRTCHNPSQSFTILNMPVWTFCCAECYGMSSYIFFPFPPLVWVWLLSIWVSCQEVHTDCLSCLLTRRLNVTDLWKWLNTLF